MMSPVFSDCRRGLEFIDLFDTPLDFTLQITVIHSLVSSVTVVTIPLVTASNGGHYPSSVFQKIPLASPTATLLS
jgi:hypothetical protein